MENFITIRDARSEEFEAIGRLTVRVYRALEGMPKEDELPDYYALLADTAGRLSDASVKIIVAVNGADVILGGVTYYGKMEFYGSGGTATLEKDASGIRLLAVDEKARGQGIGKKLTEYCVMLAKNSGNSQVILHTTKAMRQAWEMYERMGFNRSPDLDFLQGPLEVFGFRKLLDT